ncbi:MAG: hypothetical protein K8R21_11100 [Leptospira sp.]|nr:hypothetical protein [Leptospira sp.]
MAAAGFTFLGTSIIIAAIILTSVRIYMVRPDFIMKFLRYAVVGIFWIGFSAGAIAIGFRISDRHTQTYTRSLKSVGEIWGGFISQSPPRFGFKRNITEDFENHKTGQFEKRTREAFYDHGFLAQIVELDIRSNVRMKGLLKFPGYKIHFSGKYTVKNNLSSPENFYFDFNPPHNAGNITDISVNLDGKEYKSDSNYADGVNWAGLLKPQEERTIIVRYAAQGTKNFKYALAEQKIEIKHLSVIVKTDFANLNIPEQAMPATETVSDAKITQLKWIGENLITGQNVSVDFEIDGNYGSIAAKLFYYSPLSLALFTGLILLFTVSRGISLHPMHYLFLMAGFFIFYLLGSYMISYMHIFLGISVSLLVSSGIIIYYSFLLKKGNEFFKIVCFSVIIFQWILSIAFFFPEHTGLLITIAVIVSFIALMKVTADTDWESKF